MSNLIPCLTNFKKNPTYQNGVRDLSGRQSLKKEACSPQPSHQDNPNPDPSTGSFAFWFYQNAKERELHFETKSAANSTGPRRRAESA